MPTGKKNCPKCKEQCGAASHSCPHCGYAFVSVKTTRVIHKPPQKRNQKTHKVTLAEALAMLQSIHQAGYEIVPIGGRNA